MHALINSQLYMYIYIPGCVITTLPDGVRTRPVMNPRSLGELPREAESGISPSEQFRLRGGRAGGFGLCKGGVAFTLLEGQTYHNIGK